MCRMDAVGWASVPSLTTFQSKGRQVKQNEERWKVVNSHGCGADRCRPVVHHVRSVQAAAPGVCSRGLPERCDRLRAGDGAPFLQALFTRHVALPRSLGLRGRRGRADDWALYGPWLFGPAFCRCGRALHVEPALLHLESSARHSGVEILWQPAGDHFSLLAVSALFRSPRGRDTGPGPRAGKKTRAAKKSRGRHSRLGGQLSEERAPGAFRGGRPFAEPASFLPAGYAGKLLIIYYRHTRTVVK